MKTDGLNNPMVATGETRPSDINKTFKAVKYEFQKPYQSSILASGAVTSATLKTTKPSEK